MVNFNLKGLENFKGIEGVDGLERLFEGNFGNALAAFGALAVFIAIVIAILIVFVWVFDSIGLMNLAKKHNIPNPWLSFLPVGHSYIIGKLGFEVYNKENKNSTTFMWITLGLSAAAFVLSTSDGDLHTLVKYGLLFFETYAFYNIFKVLNPKNVTIYTVLIAILGLLFGSTFLGGILLYFMKPLEDNNIEKFVEDATIVEEKKNDKVDNKKEIKKESVKGNFCSNCGSKITKDAKFCPECGKKVN